MIEIRELTKHFGRTVAVDGLSFTVHPGQVTGFLGANGSGKSTTMRAVLGLDRATSGEALVNGKRYPSIQRPMFEVGALLDAGAVHGGRTALAHLRCLGLSNGIGADRARTVLERVGLGGVANKRVGGFSLGMKQRLGIAAALLGDPGVLLFDEPVNGLDPEGIRWIRTLMRDLAAEGRTVLVSSHLMSEMALTADHVVVIGRGRLITETSMSDLTARSHRDVLVATPDPDGLAPVLRAAGGDVRPDGADLVVTGLTPAEIGDLALRSACAIHGLTPRSASLEDAYLELTDDFVSYRAEALR
ncbi:ABC-2 type transport system ATP-binding protein [Actinokineospora alba]|uniref:ABC-2 type transport system ATP-binding protein n=1 Tax=Actinokineospora alba TaxID=504798 RepID=A0A1H0RMR4_9PSEU|nr:ATP-binding cassette domain-containing protein [Actinokineospora alba]TDP67024.1 ABC-2 type transport system ATP-binding protein [Actinokineospora alba]SDJ31419.1 ABC-2 type transport system ATP-binding protein [Actinokineospora alba]SDP30268.1 ABC-2 type transport system ATP-binding protein [Actinokineospora alba]